MQLFLHDHGLLTPKCDFFLVQNGQLYQEFDSDSWFMQYWASQSLKTDLQENDQVL